MATDDKKLIRINGRVIDTKTNIGISAVQVEAWDKDSIVKEPFVTAVTDQQGAFILEFKKNRLANFFGERQPQLFFKVFRDATLIASTHDSIIWTTDSSDAEIVIQVESSVAPPHSDATVDPPKDAKPLKIRGQIRRKNGSPFTEAIVRVFITTAGKEISVGEAQTDSTGSYVIASTDSSLATQPAGSLLEARVFDKKNTTVGASSSPLQDRVTTMDVVVELPGEEQCAVSGQVFQKDGKPLSSGIVRVYGAVPAERALDKATATITAVDDGRFRIEYQPAEFSPRISEGNRVEVRVFRVVNSKEQELVQSPSIPVQFRADAEQSLNIHLGDNDEPPVPTRTFTVHGRITRGGTALVSEFLTVSAFDESLPLGKPAQSDANGEYSITYTVGPPSGDIAANPTHLKVTVVDGPTSTSVALGGAATGDDEINVDLPAKPPGPSDSTVEGVVFMDYRLAANNIVVRVYHRGFGNSEQMLRQTNTAPNGSFKIDYDSGGKVINLEVRVVDPAGKEVPISNIRFKANKHEVFTLIAPASVQPLVPSEYKRLIADLNAQLPANVSLGDAREDASHKDLTMLRQATGWDARFIALAALADKLSGETGVRKEALYGLFRAGLPTDKQLLAGIDSSAVQNALDKANQAGIIGLTTNEINAAKTALRTLADQVRLDATAPGALSNISSMLNASTLTGPQKDTFKNLFFENPNGGADLWRSASAANLPVAALQLQGKLAYLTFNNAALSASVQSEILALTTPSGRPVPQVASRLVDLHLYKADEWKARLNSLAASASVAGFIPPAYTGETTNKRLDAYADDLARRVRLSFPTQVVGSLIKANTIKLGDDSFHAVMKDPVFTFLANAAALGFELGRVPVETFIAQQPPGATLFAGISPDKHDATTQSIKQLQRLYQITPSNESLSTVYKLGFNSARNVTAFPFTEFMDRFGKQFPSPAEAQLVYRKAQQVSAVVYNFVVAANQIGSAPDVFAISSSAGREAAKSNLIKHFPTLESLFGSLDFCECEHCRSVLSPAAYLVDLLQFLDPEQSAWDNTLSKWKEDHGDADYPFAAPSEQDAWRRQNPHPDPNSNPDLKNKRPYEVLVDRRADLPHLQLTCENTNTVLPYIDLVNEILEYYVANDQLGAGAARDTGAATSPDLLAEPQNITATAYDENHLRGAKYPLGLPFDLWLETVRTFCEHFETPLWRVLEVFRANDELFPHRSRNFSEYLGISPAEYSIFTEGAPLTNWHKLYGYLDQPTALGELINAKTLSRRLGVTYKELIDLLQTSFVNPRLSTLGLLTRLGIGVSDAFRSTRHAPYTGYQQFTTEEESAFEARLDEAFKSTGFNAIGWFDRTWQSGAFTKILRLFDPNTGCNFDMTTLHYSEGSDAKPLDFLKLNLFVRLWRKLGWTIDETDRALQVFIAAASLAKINDVNVTDANRAAALGPAFKTALIYLSHLVMLDTRVEAGKNSHSKLLTVWSNLSTTGENPLYAQLFLTPSILKNDPVFDDPLGNYLSQAGLVINDHLLALQGALNLTADDIGRILDDSGINITAELSLANVSLLYRYGLLAKALKLSVSDLISLKALSGLDPFKRLSVDPLIELETDYPFTQALRFVEAAEKVKASGLQIEDLDYLLRRRFDPVGKYRQDSNALLALARRLAGDLGRLRDEQAVLDNVDDGALRQRLGIVMTPELLASFMSAISGTSETEVTRDVPDTAKLDPKVFAGEQDIRVSYDDVLLRQRLTIRGLLLDAKRDRLQGAPPLPLLLHQAQALSFESLVNQIAAVVESLTDTVEYHAILTAVGPSQQLSAAAFADGTAIRVSYDQENSTQRLICRGLLLDAAKNSLKAANASSVLGNLLDSVQSQARKEAEALIKASLGMAVDSIEFEAADPNVQPAASLDPGKFERDASIRVEYDAVSLWDPSIEYNEGDVVTSNGEAWIAKRANKNIAPANGDDWRLTQGRRQRLVVRGLLSDAKRAKLQTQNPASTPAGVELSRLLDVVQDQSRAFIEQLRVGFFSTSDFKPVIDDIAGISDAPEQRRAALVRACLPFILRKLTRQLVVQTMASELSADPALTEALLTDDRLLIDPREPATPLLDGFTEVADLGVTASFFALPDLTGVSDERLVASVDTIGKPVALITNSVYFQGYVEAPTDGPYRFFVRLQKQNARVELRIGNSADPLLSATADSDGAEVSAHVELKAGVPYLLSLDAQNLAGGSVELLVQGQGLPKGSVSRLRLYAADAVERLRRARTLLANSLQIISGLVLTEREVRYLLTPASDFGGIDLSKLPATDAASSQVGTSLFSQFLRLSDYVLLRTQLAGGTDDLISVFEHARQKHPETVADLSTRVAELTRRDEASVQVAAHILGLTPADFAQEQGLTRLWEVLQVVQQFGVPVDSIASSMGIVDATKPETERVNIARNLRNTVKARYEPETWQRIAQPIFDKLRRKQRDALVAYIVHQKSFESMEELFEYFLIDPGMEPVVQTSRLRLAISSVQLFIQRCLLNLERWVHPSAINSAHWEWMKRYRVWEANRKIFLFPENWLEPEFRDDKTHLFQELEGSLLQGDVSNDLAEGAFFTYLQKLEELARLELVTIYAEEKPGDAGSNTLHVIGRTYGLPHKYFYRRYAHQMWTPWEPVTAEIEGDHVVAVMWRQRLHLFWLTFMEKADPNANDDMNSEQMAKRRSKEIKPQHFVDAQLNWSEHFQGEWTPRKSAGFSPSLPVPLAGSSTANGEAVVFVLTGGEPPRGAAESFNAERVFVHVTREIVGDEERKVDIHLSGQINWVFRFAKNSPQDEDIFGAFTRVFSLASAQTPYLANALQVTHLRVNGALAVILPSRTVRNHPVDILQPAAGAFSMLRSSNVPEITSDEIRALVSPFFLTDNQNTFFVEPTLTETTIPSSDYWVVPPSTPDPTFFDPKWFQDLPLGSLLPFVDPGFPFTPDSFRLFEFKPNEDWLVDSGTVLGLGESFIGAGGGIDFGSSVSDSPLNFSGNVLLLNGTNTGGGLSLVGSAGLSRVLLNNLIIRRESNSTQGLLGPGSTPVPTF